MPATANAQQTLRMRCAQLSSAVCVADATRVAAVAVVDLGLVLAAGELTRSALTITTKSPQSTCGVKVGFVLPRRSLAASEATRPSTWSRASITNQRRAAKASSRVSMYVDFIPAPGRAAAERTPASASWQRVRKWRGGRDLNPRPPT